MLASNARYRRPVDIDLFARIRWAHKAFGCCPCVWLQQHRAVAKSRSPLRCSAGATLVCIKRGRLSPSLSRLIRVSAAAAAQKTIWWGRMSGLLSSDCLRRACRRQRWRIMASRRHAAWFLAAFCEHLSARRRAARMMVDVPAGRNLSVNNKRKKKERRTIRIIAFLSREALAPSRVSVA